MSTPPNVASHRLLLTFAGLTAVALAFGAGRWGAPTVSPTARHSRPAPGPGAQRGDPTAAVRPSAVGLAGPAAAAVATVLPAPDLVETVRSEAAVRFELHREAIVAACWPAGGLRNGRTSARIRMNVTFDRDGREIARGIQEDRRASSSEFTHCLRSLRGTRLAVAPPGTNVGVTFPVNFP